MPLPMYDMMYDILLFVLGSDHVFQLPSSALHLVESQNGRYESSLVARHFKEGRDKDIKWVTKLIRVSIQVLSKLLALYLSVDTKGSQSTASRKSLYL
jgi:hypothetical protein